ncbi:hypothetical protein [Mesorhizobium sp. M0643]|uniref:hypothetical protein n=1 Tax=Mesorhizobium sp. M0643 TaxID=2956978 RepID=UPI003339AC99
MQKSGTLIGQLVSLGVDVNGLVIPAGSIERALGRHAVSLIVNNDADEIYKIMPITCELDSQPHDSSTLIVRATDPLDVDPDGLSGRPAFAVHYENGRPRAYFAGIIVRGGREYFRILKSGYIFAFLNSIFERQASGS